MWDWRSAAPWEWYSVSEDDAAYVFAAVGRVVHNRAKMGVVRPFVGSVRSFLRAFCPSVAVRFER